MEIISWLQNCIKKISLQLLRNAKHHRKFQFLSKKWFFFLWKQNKISSKIDCFQKIMGKDSCFSQFQWDRFLNIRYHCIKCNVLIVKISKLFNSVEKGLLGVPLKKHLKKFVLNWNLSMKISWMYSWHIHHGWLAIQPLYRVCTQWDKSFRYIEYYLIIRSGDIFPSLHADCLLHQPVKQAANEVSPL
jgi:hypothetical protein